MKKYKVTELQIALVNIIQLDTSWEKFEVEGEETNTNISIQVKIENRIDANIRISDLREEVSKLIRVENDIMMIDNKWKLVEILPLQNPENLNLLFGQVFYTHAVQRHMIQFHSSLIDYQGHGLMFLGPSGIGKTTQAELWNQYRDALIINGDIVFVQETEEAFLGWGTPWHGSSPYCENTNFQWRL